MNLQNRRIAMLAGVLTITLVTWYGVLAGSFQYDDYPNIVRDPATFNASVFSDRVTTGFRPLLRASYFLDHQLWGMRASGFLATNLALHLIAVATLFELARRRLGSALPGAVAAMIFALQPANAEVIAYVSGRSSGLSATLLLLGLLLYERSTRCSDQERGCNTSGRGEGQTSLVERQASHRWRIGAFALWISATGVKETALVFPLLLVVWEMTRPDPVPGAGKRLTPFLITGLVVALGVLAVPRIHELLAFSFALRSPLESLLHNAVALPEALSLWVRPWALSIEHPPPAWTAFRAVAGGMLLIGLAIFALVFRRRTPHVAFAILFVLTALLPTYSIVAKLDAVTEKPLYLAWAGVAMFAGAIAARHARNPAVLAAIAAVLLSGAILSANRVAVWQNPVVLWTEAVMTAPESARAWNNLGMARFNAGDLDGADAALSHALELDPSHSQAFDAQLTIRLLRETDSAPRAVEPK